MPWPDSKLVTEELSESRANEEGKEEKKEIANQVFPSQINLGGSQSLRL